MVDRHPAPQHSSNAIKGELPLIQAHHQTPLSQPLNHPTVHLIHAGEGPIARSPPRKPCRNQRRTDHLELRHATRFAVVHHFPEHIANPSWSHRKPSDPLPELPMEPNEPINTKFYQLGNGGSLIFEHDLNAVSDFLGRPHPEFHGVQLDDTPGGELQWEALARLCGQNVVRILASRYTHLVRRDATGVPMELQPHPELRHHAEHLDFMLYQTQRDLDATRAYANQTHAHITEQGEAIKLLNNDRKSLHQQRAKKDATIRRLRARIASLEATVKAQEDQIRQLEDDDGGIDIQGGDAFLSDDNDFEEDENTEEEDYEFLEAGLDDYMAPPNRTNDAMLQLLQTMLADRETERAERQANLIALQNIANQGHGNHDHPGSKLKNFQNTNPPVFSKTEEPLDADDWL
ncbi:hypothetical protein QYE76_005617 [Lolium multiflorum]|uniref:Uncharacterized protein n=1 Tax=Lolium multiflorum TaxID=4521 RepID=A0AAD8RV48_LOLMU|nr:hypothetical protein QYE76_005617 [Lolium multiflorum]